jgi:MFS family permease
MATDHGLDPRRSLASLSRFDALLLASGIWFLAKALRYAFPPLFATFESTYGVSTAVVGTVFTALMMAYAVMQFPSGALADRFGPVRVITGGVALAGAAALVVAFSSRFLVLVAAMVLVGVGTGAHKTVAVGLLSLAHPDRTGRALGVHETVGAFGGVVAPAVVVALAGSQFLGVALDWRALFLGGAVLAGALAAAFAVRAPRRMPDAYDPDAGPAADAGVREYLAPFAERRFVLFVLAMVLYAFVYTGITAFLPLFLVRHGGLTSSTAGFIYSALFVASLVQTVTGSLSDRMGALPVTGGLIVVCALALGAMLVARGPLALGAAVVAFGVGGHGHRPVRAAYLVAVIPDDVAGGTLGVVRTAIMVAAAASPAFVGVVAEAADFATAFAVLAGVTLLSGLTVLALHLTDG